MEKQARVLGDDRETDDGDKTPPPVSGNAMDETYNLYERIAFAHAARSGY